MYDVPSEESVECKGLILHLARRNEQRKREMREGERESDLVSARLTCTYTRLRPRRRCLDVFFPSSSFSSSFNLFLSFSFSFSFSRRAPLPTLCFIHAQSFRAQFTFTFVTPLSRLNAISVFRNDFRWIRLVKEARGTRDSGLFDRRNARREFFWPFPGRCLASPRLGWLDSRSRAENWLRERKKERKRKGNRDAIGDELYEIL